MGAGDLTLSWFFISVSLSKFEVTREELVCLRLSFPPSLPLRDYDLNLSVLSLYTCILSFVIPLEACVISPRVAYTLNLTFSGGPS